MSAPAVLTTREAYTMVRTNIDRAPEGILPYCDCVLRQWGVVPATDECRNRCLYMLAAMFVAGMEYTRQEKRDAYADRNV